MLANKSHLSNVFVKERAKQVLALLHDGEGELFSSPTPEAAHLHWRRQFLKLAQDQRVNVRSECGKFVKIRRSQFVNVIKERGAFVLFVIDLFYVIIAFHQRQ